MSPARVKPVDTFQESAAKQAIRGMLVDAARGLGRSGLTYLGLPGHRALDVMALAPYLGGAICVDRTGAVLDACSTTIARCAQIRVRRFEPGEMEEYLVKKYPSEPLIADVTFLDFNSGGIASGAPFQAEIAGLRAYFAKQATVKERAYVLAWTYMPRDKGEEPYRQVLSHMPLDPTDRGHIAAATGTRLRSLAVRMTLRQQLQEHGMQAYLYQHALYKKTMNTVIIVFSRGSDTSCTLPLSAPGDVMKAPVVRYPDDGSAPQSEYLV